MREVRAAVTSSLPASLLVSVTYMSYSTAPEAKDKHLSFFVFKSYSGHNLQRQEEILSSISSLIKNTPEFIFTTIYGPVNHQSSVSAPWEDEQNCTKCRNQPWQVCLVTSECHQILPWFPLFLRQESQRHQRSLPGRGFCLLARPNPLPSKYNADMCSEFYSSTKNMQAHRPS